MTAPGDTEEFNMVDARRELTRLPERLESRPATVAVTGRGRPVLAIMSWEDYKTILETLEVLGDEQAVRQLGRSVQDVKDGKAITWEGAKTRTGS